MGDLGDLQPSQIEKEDKVIKDKIVDGEEEEEEKNNFGTYPWMCRFGRDERCGACVHTIENKIVLEVVVVDSKL